MNPNLIQVVVSVLTNQRFKIISLFLLLITILLVVNLNVNANNENAFSSWSPAYLEIGMSDLTTRPPLFQIPEGVAYRQQYLSGGAGFGWTTWNENGNYVKFYIEDSIEQDRIPIFTYYMICQSGHGGAGNGRHPCYSKEQTAIRDNLANSNTMQSYWDDLKLFFEISADFPDQEIILHIEPDMWGHLHLLTPGNNLDDYPYSVQVNGSGHPDLAGLPNTPQGFADALFALREITGAENVLIGYHVSTWGTGVDFALSNPSPNELQTLAQASIDFYQSLDQLFDVTFFEIRDRDAGFYEDQYGQPDAWWELNDWDNHISWINQFTLATDQTVALWQLPYGNTASSQLDNSWGFYQDNIVETLLGQEEYQMLNRYADVGVVALIFGQGAPGTTCPCDNNGDGLVDDGGYFNTVASVYINENRILINPDALEPTPTSIPSLTPTSTYTATLPASTPGPTMTSTAVSSPTSTLIPTATSIILTLTPTSTYTATLPALTPDPTGTSTAVSSPTSTLIPTATSVVLTETPTFPSSTSTPIPASTPIPTGVAPPEIISLDPIVNRFTNGIVISWNDIEADVYEIWWNTEPSFYFNDFCGSVDRCEMVAGTEYMAILPNNVDLLYYVLVARKDGGVSEVSEFYIAVRLNEIIYLPVVLN